MKAKKRQTERRADERICFLHANETVLFVVAVVVIFVRGKKKESTKNSSQNESYADEKSRLLVFKYWTSKMRLMATKLTMIFAKRLKETEKINKVKDRKKRGRSRKKSLKISRIKSCFP